MLQNLHSTRRDGFSLLELIVTVAIIALLAGTLLPTVLRSKKDAQVAEILSTYNTLKQACERYYLNVGSFPEENKATDKHDLFTSPAVQNWKGPYISKPLEFVAGCDAILLNKLDLGTAIPVSFNMDGTDLSGDGCALSIANLPADVAQGVNDALETNQTGSSWDLRGRVIYKATTAGASTGSGGGKSGGTGGASGSTSSPSTLGTIAILIMQKPN